MTPKGVLTNMYQHMKLRYKVDFTLKEFQEKYLNDSCYIGLHKRWSESGHNKQLKPSLDRVDCRGHYSWDNVEMMTWTENREKQSSVDGKRGRKPAVLQIYNGEIVRRFESQLQAIKELGLHQGNLSSVLNGRRKFIGGYTYIYENNNLLQKINEDN